MRKNKIYASFFIIILLSIILVQCATNPVTGKKEIMLISKSMEIQMGKEIDQAIKNEYGIYYDPQLDSYLNRIARKLVPHCHRPGLKYYFSVLDTPVENAFAAPGGYIYITRGLLALMNSEAELAVVLGHELGHVNARHSARSMTKSILFSIGLAIATELSEDIRKIAPIAQIATQLLFLKYSRKDEYQADSLGVEYSRKAGYVPGKMVDFFNSLTRLSSTRGSYHLPNFLSTHPLTPRRIEKVKEQLIPTDSKLAVRKNNYLGKVNGMIYGSNPRQGYIEGNHFYHPDMKFYFRIPRGWKSENTPQRVTMASKDGNGLIIFSAKKSSMELDNFSKKMITEISNSKVLSQSYRSINGLRALHSELNVKTNNESTADNSAAQNMKVRLTHIRKGSMIYSFLALSPKSQFISYKNDFSFSIHSFKNLTDKRHLRRKPLRIYTKKVSGKQTLKAFLNRQNVPRKIWKNIAIINLLNLDDTVTQNQLIKIIK
jgi:predicted Zn-dependent protease